MQADEDRVKEEILQYLLGLKGKVLGLIGIVSDPAKHVFEVELDASFDLFASRCIFDSVSDEHAIVFLNKFLDKTLYVGWSISEQLCKLLSVRGHLVAQRMQTLVDSLLRCNGWIGAHQLFLSYLALHPQGADLASSFLDCVPEDCRDGLFLACHRLNSSDLDRKLMHKFVEWYSTKWSPGSTGELYALEQFIAKWIGLYPYEELEPLVRMYFKYRTED